MNIPSITVRIDKQLKLSGNKRIDGNTTLFEQKVLASLIRKHKPRRILEIGTFNGLSTLHMAMNAPDAELVTVDIEGKQLDYLKLPIQKNKNTYEDARYIRKSMIGELFKGKQEEKRVTQVLCDSALLHKKIKKKFDFIFIDGSHSYEYTMNDSRFALEHLNKNGVVLWHDYGKKSWPGVKKALDKLRGNFDVKRISKTSFIILEL